MSALLSVAIVIPVWKEKLTEYEKISFAQCCSILGKHTICLISYKELNLEQYVEYLKSHSIKYRIILFNKKDFSSVESYSKLMLSIKFYLRFISYKYILVYQLDSFVFRDDLEQWVRLGYSYIGAPWLKGYSLARYGDSENGVGNGGFSLRCVKDHIRALISFSYIKKPKKLLYDYLTEKGKLPKHGHLEFIKNLIIQNNTFSLLNNWSKNEDVFWGKIANKNFSWFTVPDWLLAAQFSIEVQPAYFFKINNMKLPFGCHGWWTYDLDYWKKHINEFGYKLPDQVEHHEYDVEST